WLRARDTAVTQVDVVAHSLGALMMRSRVAYKQWPHRRFLNYGVGDFHKLISIGAPHRGSPLATVFLTYRCRPFLRTTLQGFFEFWIGPFGQALYELQPGSEALRRIGAAPILQVRTYPIVGIEPASVGGCVGSCTEENYDWILSKVGEGETINTILGGNGLHDTIVSISSQRAGLSTITTDVFDVVHADGSLTRGDPEELASETIWFEVDALLHGSLFDFFTLPGYSIAREVISDEPCPAEESSVRPEAATTTVVSLLPAPGTIVNPGDTVNVVFEIQDGNPVDGAGFAVGDRFHFIDGPGPFAFSFPVPAERLGELTILTGTTGPGPENYDASTYVVVHTEQPPTSISVSPAHLALVRLGELQGLTVRGLYPDGSEADLTSPSSGTVYAVGSGTSDVVAVSPEGLIQAIGAGEDEIVVSNSGLAVQVPVKVTLSNLPPIINVPAAVTVEAERTLQVPFTVTDPEDGPFTLSVDGLPGFATFTDLGGGSGQIDLQPQRIDLGTYTILITAIDEGIPALGGTARVTIEVVPCQEPLPGQPIVSLVGNMLSWTPAENASAYDVVGGFVDQLRSSGGDFSVSTAACIVNDRTTTSVLFSGTPAPGTAFWLVVRSVSCAGNGSYDAPLPNSQVASRDPGIAASPIKCP
ncbi:MAG: cadherin repeat domain-containing protein, partial [Acidobacteriota bacterium]